MRRTEWLQDAGPVEKGKRRGTPRRRRERAPIPGLPVHRDGSTHEWAPGAERDLIVTMDDATSEVYSGFFVEEEGTWSSFRGVRETLEKRGLFGSLYTDRGSHYRHTPAAGGKVDKANPTQFGRAMAELGIGMIPSYTVRGAGPLGALLRDGAGAAAAGVGAGGRDRSSSIVEVVDGPDRLVPHVAWVATATVLALVQLRVEGLRGLSFVVREPLFENLVEMVAFSTLPVGYAFLRLSRHAYSAAHAISLLTSRWRTLPYRNARRVGTR